MLENALRQMPKTAEALLSVLEMRTLIRLLMSFPRGALVQKEKRVEYTLTVEVGVYILLTLKHVTHSVVEKVKIYFNFSLKFTQFYLHF